MHIDRIAGPVPAIAEALAVPVLRTDRAAPDADAVRRRAAAGELTPVARARYVETRTWEQLRPHERHALRIAATVDRLPSGTVLSRRSAAVLWGIPIVDGWESRVQVDRVGVGARTTNATFVVHASPESDGDLVRIRGVGPATGPERTLVDLAVTLDLRDAVVALDHGLSHGFDPAALRSRILARGRYGRTRALRALDFADGASGSVGESMCRVLFERIGAPRPVLQQRFRLASGRDAVVDFWFPEYGVVVEFDGETKYTDPAMLGGRTTQRALIDEKHREDRLRAEYGVRVVRLRWADLFRPDVVRLRLREAGLPV